MDTESTAVDLLLSETEIADMDRLETKIQHGLDTFMEVGAALMEINGRKLYRQTHATFADYCRERWNMGKTYAYDLIKAARIGEQLLSANADISQPEHESQLRPLGQIAPEYRAEAWQRAVATAPEGDVTGEHVQAVVDQMLGKAGRFEAKKSYPVYQSGKQVFNAPMDSYVDFNRDGRFYACQLLQGQQLNDGKQYDAYALVAVPEVHPQEMASVLPFLVDQRLSNHVWPIDRTRRIIFDAPFVSEALAARNLYADCTWIAGYSLKSNWASVIDCLGEFQVRPARLLLADWTRYSKFQPGMKAKCPTCATSSWQKDHAVAPYEKWRIVEQDVWGCPNGHRVADDDLDFDLTIPGVKVKTAEETAQEKADFEAHQKKVKLEIILGHIADLDDLLKDIAKQPDLVLEALAVEQITAYRKVSWHDGPSKEAVAIAIGWLAEATQDESLIDLVDTLDGVDWNDDADEDEDDADEDEDESESEDADDEASDIDENDIEDLRPSPF